MYHIYLYITSSICIYILLYGILLYYIVHNILYIYIILYTIKILDDVSSVVKQLVLIAALCPSVLHVALWRVPYRAAS